MVLAYHNPHTVILFDSRVKEHQLWKHRMLEAQVDSKIDAKRTGADLAGCFVDSGGGSDQDFGKMGEESGRLIRGYHKLMLQAGQRPILMSMRN